MAQFALRNAAHHANLFANALWRVACIVATMVPETLITWQERSEQRQALMMLDRRLLDDIGVRQIDARREAFKPFWKA